jgi:heme/copper-type cytochrome/quinol oxidase subunit 2
MQGKVNQMVIVASLIYLAVLSQAAAGDQEALSDMNDLGMWMLGGFVLAVAGAIALTVIRLRIREKKPEAPQFVSISSRKEE